MPANKQAPSKGRPKLSPVERERREAARRLKELSEVREEFNKLLSLDERSEEDKKEIQEVADKRRTICAAIDAVSDEVRDAREAGKTSLEEKHKRIRSELYDNLNQYPELGYTYREWDRLPESAKGKELGRPKLRIEQRLNRAEDAFKAQEELLRNTEIEHGVEHISIAKQIKEVENPGVGRPRLSPTERLDRKRLKLEEEIEHIESGRAQAEQDAAIRQKMKDLDVDSPSELPGRPPVPMKFRLEVLKDRHREISKEIEDQIAEMSELEQIQHQISAQKIRLRAIKRRVKKEGDPSGQLDEQVASMEAMMKNLEKMARNMEEEEGAAIAHSDTQATESVASEAEASKPKEKPQKKVQEESVKQPTPKVSKPSESPQEPLPEVKSKAKATEQRQGEERMESMRDVLDSLLADIDMSTDNSGSEETTKRSRLRDRLIPKASNG